MCWIHSNDVGYTLAPVCNPGTPAPRSFPNTAALGSPCLLCGRVSGCPECPPEDPVSSHAATQMWVEM